MRKASLWRESRHASRERDGETRKENPSLKSTGARGSGSQLRTRAVVSQVRRRRTVFGRRRLTYWWGGGGTGSPKKNNPESHSPKKKGERKGRRNRPSWRSSPLSDRFLGNVLCGKPAQIIWTWSDSSEHFERAQRIRSSADPRRREQKRVAKGVGKAQKIEARRNRFFRKKAAGARKRAAKGEKKRSKTSLSRNEEEKKGESPDAAGMICQR